MSSSGNVIALRSATPEREQPFVATDADIADAIGRAQQNLLRQQHEDGHWCGELLVDSTLARDSCRSFHWLGRLAGILQDGRPRTILKRQLREGGWNIYFAVRGGTNASWKGYLEISLPG